MGHTYGKGWYYDDEADEPNTEFVATWWMPLPDGPPELPLDGLLNRLQKLGEVSGEGSFCEEVSRAISSLRGALMDIKDGHARRVTSVNGASITEDNIFDCRAHAADVLFAVGAIPSFPDKV